jgi:hypothetical protein
MSRPLRLPASACNTPAQGLAGEQEAGLAAVSPRRAAAAHEGQKTQALALLHGKVPSATIADIDKARH